MTITPKMEDSTAEKRPKLVLYLPQMPPSVNHIWKRRVVGNRAITYVTKEGKEFKSRLAAEVPDGQIVDQGGLYVKIFLTFPDRRRRDIDNYSKAILDSLNGIVWVDDNQIDQLYIEKRISDSKPKQGSIRLEVYAWETEDG